MAPSPTRCAASLCVFLAVLTGCGSPPPRTSDEIFADKMELPRVYLTKKTHVKIIAPKSKGQFVDETTHEECWPAQHCLNPDCPRAKDPEPYLFTVFDVEKHNGCPACAKNRKFAKESKDVKAKFATLFGPYELPENAERLKKLDEEYAARVAWEAKKK